MRAVTNAGPLIHPSWIGRLDLLPALFDAIIAPVGVRDEVLNVGPDIPGATALREAFAAGWPVVQPVNDAVAVDALMAVLDRGEAEAIVLMREAATDIILLDERRAREYAMLWGIPMTGTLGILRTARDAGLIPAVLPLLEELRQRGFRISAELAEEIRSEEAGPRES